MRKKHPDSSRRLVLMPEQLWHEVEAYRQREALGSVAEAIRQLVKLGLRAANDREKAGD